MEDRQGGNKKAREDFSFEVGAYPTKRLVFVGQILCDIQCGRSVRGQARRARNQK